MNEFKTLNMRDLSNFIKIVPLSDFQSFDGTDIITVSGSDPDLIPSNNDLKFEETPEKTRSGVIYNQSLTVVCDKLSESLRTRYQNNRPVVVQLFTDDNVSRQCGDDSTRARILITPGTDYDILTINRKSKKPVF